MSSDNKERMNRLQQVLSEGLSEKAKEDILKGLSEDPFLSGTSASQSFYQKNGKDNPKNSESFFKEQDRGSEAERKKTEEERAERAEAERKREEAKRAKAERKRAERAEADRKRAEEDRKRAEEDRKKEAAERKRAEEDRKKKESEREKAEEEDRKIARKKHKEEEKKRKLKKARNDVYSKYYVPHEKRSYFENKINIIKYRLGHFDYLYKINPKSVSGKEKDNYWRDVYKLEDALHFDKFFNRKMTRLKLGLATVGLSLSLLISAQTKNSIKPYVPDDNPTDLLEQINPSNYARELSRAKSYFYRGEDQEYLISRIKPNWIPEDVSDEQYYKILEIAWYDLEPEFKEYVRNPNDVREAQVKTEKQNKEREEREREAINQLNEVNNGNKGNNGNNCVTDEEIEK